MPSTTRSTALLRLPRRLTAAVAVLAAVLATLAAVGAPASAARPSVHHAGQARAVTTYTVSRPVCAAPARPGQFTCMAYRLVDVPKATPKARACAIPWAARGPVCGYTPAAIAKAYGVNPNLRTHQTVGIVDWYNNPSVRSDLNHFDAHYGLPRETTSSFRVVNENGKASPLPADDHNAAVEISLDVQAVRAVCHTCRIVLVEASQASSVNLARAENTAVRLGAKVVSNSFGAAERRGHPFPSSVVRAFSHPGVVTTASSGDNGWDYWDIANADSLGYATYAPQAASFPASVTGVVSVGGTRLTVNPDGTRNTESVWNGNGASDSAGRAAQDSLGASGGGCSTQFAAPAWQRAIDGYRQSGCAGKRLSVDVSAAGDPATGLAVYDSYSIGGWAAIGGTSLSSPLVAGLWALAGGARGVTHPAQVLYQNLQYRSSALHDVTVGGNAYCAGASTAGCSSATSSYWGTTNPNHAYGALVDCSFPRSADVTTAPPKSPQCNAIAGYDGASGVGTPHGLTLFRTTLPTVSLTTSAVRKARHAITFTAHVYKVIAKTYTARRAWSWGDGTSSVTTTTITTHRYTKPGTYAARVTITDTLGQRATTVKTITVQ